jgi:hypothetical protein
LVCYVVLAVVILALINNVPSLAPLRGLSGPFLIIAVLASLVATLSREAFSPTVSGWRKRGSSTH